MLTKSMSRGLGRALTVLTVLTSLTGLAQAQQNGLFPLAPIRRERVPCPAEEPIYKLYRSQYYGYYPPQWRQFPQGWHLNSPQRPNRAEELKKQPILPITPLPPEDGGEEPEGGRQAIPNPPAENERSPFEMDRPGNVQQPAPGAGTRRPAAPPAQEPSPFEMPADQPAEPRTPEPRRPETKPPGTDSPDLDAPGAPGATDNGPRAETEASDRGPLLAMPDATLPPVEEAGPMYQRGASESVLGGPGASAPVVTEASPQPQPAPRRSRLSALFDGLGLSRLRR